MSFSNRLQIKTGTARDQAGKSKIAILSRSGILAAAMAMSVTSASIAAPADKLLDQAAQQYKSANYGQAAVILEKAIKQSPQNAEAHYYLANCDVYLKHSQDAASEYKKVLEFGGNTAPAIYAHQALVSMGVIHENGPANNAPSPEAVNRSMAAIQRQEAQQQNSLRRRTAAAIDDINQAGIEHAQTVEIKGAQRVADMRDAYLKTRWGGIIPLYTDSEIADATYRSEIRAAQLREETDATTANKQRGYLHRAEMTHEAAANLADQLQQRSLATDGFNILPEGTNLYVRNYGTK